MKVDLDYQGDSLHDMDMTHKFLPLPYPTNSPSTPLTTIFPQPKHTYQTVGPKNLPVALGFGFVILTAASKLSILLFATLTPHQLGIDVFVRLTARMITIVQIANPVSRPADVM